MKYRKLLILFGGNNYEYFNDGLSSIILFKKNIKVIVVTKNCSIEIYNKILSNFDKKIIYRTNNFKLSKTKLLNIKQNCDLGINIGFNYILKKNILDLLPILNPHPSYLPFNRGCHHSFWSIIDKTPPGATLHMMNEQIDGGDIIIRKKIKTNYLTSAEEIQKRSEKLAMELLTKNLEKILKGKFKLSKQNKHTYHSKKQILKRSTLKSNDSIKVIDLFNLIRATFNKNNGFYIKHGNKKILIKVKSYKEVR